MPRLLSTTYALLIVVACARAAGAQAPDPHTAQPERPTVATHAGTVAAGWIEVEAGGEFDRYDDRSRGGSAPIVAKIGLASRAQLGAFASVVSPPGSGVTRVGDLAAGVKYRFTDNAPVVGRLAILPIVKLPTGSTTTGTGTGTTDLSIVVISSHDLGPVALDLNAGYTRRSGTDEIAPRNATVWTVSFGGPAAGAVGWAAELYGYPGTSGPAGSDAIVAVLFGPTVTIRPWLVLDTGIIHPVRGPQPRAFYVGTTYNIGRFWR
jgi:hypothetical protein